MTTPGRGITTRRCTPCLARIAKHASRQLPRTAAHAGFDTNDDCSQELRMAQSISDVFSRAHDSDRTQRRTARFVAPKSDEAPPSAAQTPTLNLSAGEADEARRAAFRPRESVALRRDVLEAFVAASLADRAHVEGDDAEVAHRHIEVARACEALGDFERALEMLRCAGIGEVMNWEVGHLVRRLRRALGDDEAVIDALERALALRDQPTWAPVYVELELATTRWMRGASPDEVLRGCERATDDREGRACLDIFAALWALHLRCDALLERGEFEEALSALEKAARLPELSVDIRQALEARRAVWLHVFGRHDEARDLLNDLANQGQLPGDLDDLLVSLCFESGEVGRAFGVLRRSARQELRQGVHAVPLAMLHLTASDHPAAARDVLRQGTEREDDWTLLRLREHLLESEPEAQGGGGSELIDVLNRRLEGPLSVSERVSTLTRLGRLYEVEAGLAEAAAEVYREALSYDPRHVPALRALGRLYTRRENWRGLADLYEREIASAQATSGAWRRHFQLAEVYEHRLERDERALEHYLLVLEVRPNYLPALKSAARILSRLERWTQLADLFLGLVEVAPSRRQKLYLLDKVAEVAEQQLKNYEVAIGAWLEILALDESNPRCFAALGRLYARTHRWEELIALNEREIALIDDPEEVAATWLRNAEVAEQQLDDVVRAERYYRRALEELPDFLPALEALGRIYMRGSRWDEIVQMTGRELHTITDPRAAARQLGALAELLETRLERRDEAIAIYDQLLAMNPADSHVFNALSRLYRQSGAWTSLEALLLNRLAHLSGAAELAAAWGELAMIAEWRLNRPDDACARYLEALQVEPTNTHWLGGVARTWKRAGHAPEAIADQLEDLLMHATEATLRDRYFMVIARLRERAEVSPDASRAYRAHGAAESLENQIVLRVAMACAAERAELAQARVRLPHHPLQALVAMGRHNLNAWERDALASDAFEMLPSAARAFLSQEIELTSAAAATDLSGLSADLVAVLQGQEIFAQNPGESMSPAEQRLRALQARRLQEHAHYLSWTTLEADAHINPLVRASRRLEMARYASRHGLAGADDLYTLACEATFPELVEHEGPTFVPEGEAELDRADEALIATIPADCAHIEALYAALRETSRWNLLRRCLQAHVGREGLSQTRRLELFEALATLCADELADYPGAQRALTTCWQISEDAAYLRSLVELASRFEKIDDAIDFQRRHFECITMDDEHVVEERIQSGYWLGRLLMSVGDEAHLEQAIDCLEDLVHDYEGLEALHRAERLLARAHRQAGSGRRAAELYERVLKFQVIGEELEDWRALVDVRHRLLDDVAGAYTLQWQIVRAFPDSRADLDLLIDLAAEAGEVADCVEQLAQLSHATSSQAKIDLLARAAEAADEELGHVEEAARYFERLITLCEGDAERSAYFRRRRAFCLARMAGREALAMKAFRELLAEEPFEPTNYRGLETLFERAQAHDRLRLTRQTLRALGAKVELSETRTKTTPSRAVDAELVERHLIDDALRGGVFQALQATVPLAERVFSETLPQKKALDGQRLRAGDHPVYDAIADGFAAIGVVKFRLIVGDSGPEHPVVFAESTPTVWLNETLIEGLSDAGLRFVGGYCAALVVSDLAPLMSLDGRQVWHLMEGVTLRQVGRGFTDRVDLQSQELGEQVGSPFHSPARRRVAQVMEAHEGLMDRLASAHCEAWGRNIDAFAARFGLLICGDVAAAVEAMLRLEGWGMPLDEVATQKRIRHHDGVGALVAFAHDDAFLELRYRLGLAGRPSALEI
ncbi:tetratricopeptide repeat protein [Lujinxingia vulgaris]|uniref:Tetratricopeptide repeat protein n=2 Tax=Lujinxingia vulgaris TaxID=2600176 RepID=A0A5C6X1Y0_9DELT|nr:tetratricopeptide repeat protein [Lujinxingia vulgaris]